MENKENKSLTDLVDEGVEELDGRYASLFNALAREFDEEEVDEDEPGVEFAFKLSLLASKIGAYVLDHAEAFPELLNEFQTEMDELETLCNQQEESEEDKEQD